MAIVATVLFSLVSLLQLGLTWSMRRTGPEGPVGAHMVTAPLGLLQAIALGLAFAGGVLDGSGVPTWIAYASLPGWVVTMTVAPILAYDRRHRGRGRAVVTAAAVAGLVTGFGPTASLPMPVLAVAWCAVAAVALGGYGMLAALWWSTQRNRMRAAIADAERTDEFEKGQAQWQRAEYAKLPADAALWQLIQFVHSFAPEVKAGSLARIAALPYLEADMQALLATGWAEHAMDYLAQHYPRPFAPLAAPFAAFMSKECDRWADTLRGDHDMSSWYWNLVRRFEVAERVQRDGGDVRAAMAAWAKMLQKARGLGELQQRAAKLAAG